MATQANLIATYQSNPTLQGRYTQQEYLDMFGFGDSTTPTPDPDPTPTPTPDEPGLPNIINQNLNQGGGDGPRGGGAFGNLDMSTAKKFDIDGKTVTGYKNLGTGLYQDFDGYNIQNLGIRNFGLTGILEGIFGKGDDPKYPGLFDKVSFGALIKNPGLYKSFFDRQDVAKQQRIKDEIDAFNRAELAKLEQKRQAEANARGLREQVSITAMNKAGNVAQSDRTGGNVNTGGAAGNMGGGSRQATSAGSTKSGRTDGGWGWKDGGRVYLYNRLK
jgi:hypothetical protein